MHNSDREWEAWGAKDPYYGVVSDEKFHASAIDKSREEFFRTGEDFIQMILAEAIAAYGPLARKSALDFGCGVGRLTMALAQQFDFVTGVDVSHSMLKIAGQNCRGRFLSSLDDVSEEFDFVISYIVLQHIPVDRGYVIIDKLLKRLRNTGVAMLHVSIKRNYSPVTASAYWLKHNIPVVRPILNLVRGKPLSASVMQMNEYDLGQVLSIFEKNNMSDIKLIREVHHKVDTVRILGRKL